MRSGRFWMALWITAFVATLLWGVGTVIWWLDSVRNVNLMSTVALLLAAAGGLQATLAMRKADDDDSF